MDESEQDRISLKEFFTVLLKEQEMRINLRFDAMDKALNVARETLERSDFIREGHCIGVHKTVNEWRTGVDEKILNHDTRLTKAETRSITWTAAVGILFLLLNVIMRFYRI